MARPIPAKKILFLHIPKTAGTSLREIVRRNYPGDRCVFVYSLEPAYLQTLQRDVERAEAVFGHFSFGFHDLFGVEARYVTVLRNPIDRVVSFFRHEAKHDDNEYYRQIADGMTLKDLLRSEQCHQVNNHMVRIITGHTDFSTTHDVRLLRQAEANLESHFDAVGIAEQMDRTVELIGGRLGWPRRSLGWARRSKVERLNVDLDSPSFVLDESTRAEIERFNTLDLELYRGAARRFAGRHLIEPAGAGGREVHPEARHSRDL
jgi:Sulfotransferase family